jgi:hypothetical protein
LGVRKFYALYETGYCMPSVGNIIEEKCCAGISEFPASVRITEVCWKYSLATFWWWRNGLRHWLTMMHPRSHSGWRRVAILCHAKALSIWNHFRVRQRQSIHVDNSAVRPSFWTRDVGRISCVASRRTMLTAWTPRLVSTAPHIARSGIRIFLKFVLLFHAVFYDWNISLARSNCGILWKSQWTFEFNTTTEILDRLCKLISQ